MFTNSRVIANMGLSRMDMMDKVKVLDREVSKDLLGKICKVLVKMEIFQALPAKS